MGGVENHIYQLSQCLIARGHKVIVVTHSYGERSGIRYLSNFLKVYYLPILAVYNQVTLPTLLTALPLLRDIFIREQITIVHGHGAFSALCHEGILHARATGIRAVFTDHSLFGFADASSVITNKFLEVILTDVDHVICVSYTSKENTVLRASLKPESVSVIPNAVDTSCFTPHPSSRKEGQVTVVVMSRLVYRKGTDLLAAIIPILCANHSDVHFLIGGDGPKRVLLEETRERFQLQDRVQLLGSLDHAQVRNVLVQGDIFLNTSLTEAFCIAIVEAASCGLQVVSTSVGGIPEVLPPDLIWIAEPNVQALTKALEQAIQSHRQGTRLSHQEMHNRVKPLYTWQDAAKRTDKIYDSIQQNPNRSLVQQISKYYKIDMFGWFYVAVLALLHLLVVLMRWINPTEDIDIVPSIKQNKPARNLVSHDNDVELQ